MTHWFKHCVNAPYIGARRHPQPSDHPTIHEPASCRAMGAKWTHEIQQDIQNTRSISHNYETYEKGYKSNTLDSNLHRSYEYLQTRTTSYASSEKVMCPNYINVLCINILEYKLISDGVLRLESKNDVARVLCDHVLQILHQNQTPCDLQLLSGVTPRVFLFV